LVGDALQRFWLASTTLLSESAAAALVVVEPLESIEVRRRRRRCLLPSPPSARFVDVSRWWDGRANQTELDWPGASPQWRLDEDEKTEDVDKLLQQQTPMTTGQRGYFGGVVDDADVTVQLLVQSQL
jgi:hypothetical protein